MTVRLLPMFVVGVLCNVSMALVIGRTDVVILIGVSVSRSMHVS